MRLKDKVAIVTGSGRGIGEGIVLRFAEEGAKLIVNDVNEADAKSVVEKVKASGGKAVAVIGSVASREAVQKMVDTAIKEFGTVDIIVNNAGITRDVISSTSALGNVGQINYSASKAGVIGMTKTAAKEMGSKGVNVNAIAPGMIWTDMMKSMPPETIKQMDAMLPYIVPMNRKGSPLDIANLALFLASDESSFMVIFCDGGMKI